MKAAVRETSDLNSYLEKLKGQRKLKGPTRRVLNLALKFVLESKKNVKGILMKAKAGGFRDQ